MCRVGAQKGRIVYLCLMGNQFAQTGVMVSVLMPAFNHGKYIRQAIESFLAQEQVEARLIIGNDASTDDTLQIAAEYADKFPDRICVISNPHNFGLIGNYKSLVENSSSRYVAILESDDYWTDPLKLHKQVAYLEAHPECGLVYTSGEFVDETGNHLGVKKECAGARCRGRASSRAGAEVNEVSGAVMTDSHEQNRLLQQVLMSNPVLAVTACFRREAFEKGCCMADFVERNFVTFDYPVWIGLASCSDFYVMEEVTAAYRVGGASISNNASYSRREAFQNGIDVIVRYSLQKYNCGKYAKEILNERIVKKMILALSFSKFERYSYFCRQIDASAGLKWAVMRYFPWVFRLKKRKLIGTGTVYKLSR